MDKNNYSSTFEKYKNYMRFVFIIRDFSVYREPDSAVTNVIFKNLNYADITFEKIIFASLTQYK